MRPVFSVCLALVLCILTTPGRAEEQVVLQLKWLHAYQFAGYYMAKEKGYYRDAGLDMEIREGGPHINFVDEVISGRANYATGSTGIVLDRNNGKPVVVLGVIFQHSPDVLFVSQASGITHPQQLVGKTIMDSVSTPAVAPMLLAEAGSLKKFNIIPQNNDYQGLIESKFDATGGYSTDESFFYREKRFPITMLKPINYGVDFYGDNLFTSEYEISRHPQRVKEFRLASLKGWEYAMAHPDETIGVIQKYGAARSSGHLRFEYEAMRDLLLPEFIEMGHMNPGRWQHIADTYVKLGQMQSDYSLEGFMYDPSPVADIKKLKRYLVATFSGISVAIVIIFLLGYFNRRLAEQKRALGESEEQMRLLITNSPASLAMFDRNMCYIATSNRWLSDHRLSEQNLVGRSHYEVFPEIPERWRAIHQRCLAGATEKCEEDRFVRMDGTVEWLRWEVRPWFKANRETGGIIILTEDITGHKNKETELREANALLQNHLAEIEALQGELREQTIRDPLTGLFNRRYLDETLSRELSRAKRENSPLSVALLDIDYFKPLNDTHGHDAGDLMLQSMALLLRGHTRSADVVCRYGGEEFVVVLPATALENAQQRMEQLRCALETLRVPFNRIELHTTVSIGIATFPLHGKTDAALLRAADMALYAAKGAGRNRVMCANKAAAA